MAEDIRSFHQEFGTGALWPAAAAPGSADQHQPPLRSPLALPTFPLSTYVSIKRVDSSSTQPAVDLPKASGASHHRSQDQVLVVRGASQGAWPEQNGAVGAGVARNKGSQGLPALSTGLCSPVWSLIAWRFPVTAPQSSKRHSPVNSRDQSGLS